MRIPETIRYTRESESTFIASKSPYIKLEHDECLTNFLRNLSQSSAIPQLLLEEGPQVPFT